MSSQQSKSTSSAKKNVDAAAAILARLDRLPIWALPQLFMSLLGLGFFCTFFDISDINVSFVQTCQSIVPHCAPEIASRYIGQPVLLNLLGYVVGALIFAPLADRYGRRDVLVFSIVLTGLGSLYTALVGDYLNFTIARAITGIGVGADLALVNTYINEIAPRRGRARTTSLIFIVSTLGASLGIWLGLYLTTPGVPFPVGLPFALATPDFNFGWRVLYTIGASLSCIGLVLRFNVPESPRWLITQGRISEAEYIVAGMEKYVRKRIGVPLPVVPIPPDLLLTEGTGYSQIFSDALYFKRTILILVVWFLGYITVYSNITGETVLLTILKYPASTAGLITAYSTIGIFLCGVVAFVYSERLERKHWLLIAGIIVMVSGVVLALSSSFVVTVLASIAFSFGSYLWLPTTYTWTTENFPTRGRASGFALTDGLGHVGGGIGVGYATALAAHFGPLQAFLLISGALLVASWLAQFGPETRDKRLDDISP